MWNYHPDVVLETFVRFHPGQTFTLQELRDYDAQLFATNDAFFTSVLVARGLPNPSAYDKSKLLQIACVSPGGVRRRRELRGRRLRARAQPGRDRVIGRGHVVSPGVKASDRRDCWRNTMTDPWDDTARSQGA